MESHHEGTKKHKVHKGWNSHRTLVLLLLALAIASLLPAQEGDHGGAAKPKPIAAAEKDKLTRLLPDPRRLGATARPAQLYGSDLYRYLDGGADAYHTHGLVAMVHRQYRTKDTDVTVDVYDFGSPANARVIYAAERSTDSHLIPIGAEGYIDQNILNFVQDSFYVKLSGFSDKQQAEPAMKAFAGDISRRIRGEATTKAQAARSSQR
jgi:hypothetical protein